MLLMLSSGQLLTNVLLMRVMILITGFMFMQNNLSCLQNLKALMVVEDMVPDLLLL